MCLCPVVIAMTVCSSQNPNPAESCINSSASKLAKSPSLLTNPNPSLLWKAAEMFSSGASDQLQIIQDEKFYSRVLSKEKNSAADPSFRVYYGVAAGAVPFVWESRPGTPKHPMTGGATTLPPLTPPPSYHYMSTSGKKKKSPRYGLIHAMLPRLALRKQEAPPIPRRPPSVSWSSASSLSSNSRGDNEEQEEGMSPTSTLCFGERSGGAGRGWYCMRGMKDALLSIVGYGSNHGRTHAA